MHSLRSAGVFVVLVFLLGRSIAAADEPATEPSLSADEVYRDTFHILASGDQKSVDKVLAAAIPEFRDDARLSFFQAASIRSRFLISRSSPLFLKIAQRGDDGIWSQAARLIVGLDARTGDANQKFAALDKLSAENPDEPILLWMVAVQCRALNRNELGVERYAKLLKLMDPGPAIVHQTYANLLDELKRYSESLPHRRLAVTLEPASWTYEGLANTLSDLRRYREADADFRIAVRMNPLNDQIWRNWAYSESQRGDTATAMRYSQEARYAAQATNDYLARSRRNLRAALPHSADIAATQQYEAAI